MDKMDVEKTVYDFLCIAKEKLQSRDMYIGYGKVDNIWSDIVLSESILPNKNSQVMYTITMPNKFKIQWFGIQIWKQTTQYQLYNATRIFTHQYDKNAQKEIDIHIDTVFGVFDLLGQVMGAIFSAYYSSDGGVYEFYCRRSRFILDTLVAMKLHHYLGMIPELKLKKGFDVSGVTKFNPERIFKSIFGRYEQASVYELFIYALTEGRYELTNMNSNQSVKLYDKALIKKASSNGKVSINNFTSSYGIYVSVAYPNRPTISVQATSDGMMLQTSGPATRYTQMYSNGETEPYILLDFAVANIIASLGLTGMDSAAVSILCANVTRNVMAVMKDQIIGITNPDGKLQNLRYILRRAVEIGDNINLNSRVKYEETNNA